MATQIYGYARVSTLTKTPSCSWTPWNGPRRSRLHRPRFRYCSARPQLEALLERAGDGDTIVVWRLDRLGRNMKHLLELVADLETRGVGLRSLNEQLDTTTANGRLIFHVMAALAEFESGLLKERTRAGLAAAKAQGRIGGRPPALSMTARHAAVDLRDQMRARPRDRRPPQGVARHGVPSARDGRQP